MRLTISTLIPNVSQRQTLKTQHNKIFFPPEIFVHHVPTPCFPVPRARVTGHHSHTTRTGNKAGNCFSCGIFTALRHKHAHRHPPSSTHTFIRAVTHTSFITLKYLFHVATKSNFQHAIPSLAECLIHPSPSRLLTLSTDQLDSGLLMKECGRRQWSIRKNSLWSANILKAPHT